ncbi:bifunctional 3-(3-hydroxy-phenyl)propionate/3-hydroxycinnamic acid hydroxylase [Streptomyces cinereospinus]|uniref:Bifunctional 3-(3-hydroxy-phenyl)propionate/3-hydroxycinnamic acid hydroxylase n=1 Tax=Streptomyces cinereospinus TaxID=285561 RepID=A0ABV5N6E6_9ACTN
MSALHDTTVALPPGLTVCDVAIVGYGPVGMTCAALLAQAGLDVIVVEQHPQRYAHSRAGHLDGETMRTFQRLGIAERIELIARPMLCWQLVTAEREQLATIRLGESGSGWKADYLSHQPELEAIIDSRVLELGGRVIMGMTAEQVSQDADGVRLTVRPTADPEAGTRTIQASYLIGADGARSFVRTTLGIRREDLGFSANDELVIDFEHHDPDRDLPQLPDVYQVLDPARPQLAGRWSGGRWSRWEFHAVGDETREDLDNEETCWKLLATWGITPEHGRIDRRAVYRFESTLADRWRIGRVFLMGDAAHTMPPFMGQGMLSGVRDAVNLSWKLAAVFAGEAEETLLDTYQAERAPHVRALIDASVAVAETALLTDPERARLRDDALRRGELPTPPRFPRLGAGIVRPETAEGAVESDGRPSPQARVAFGTRVDRLDQFLTPGWTLVSRHAVPEELFDARQRRLLEELDVTFVHVTPGDVPDAYLDIDGEYDLWFRQNGQKAFLQRPDGYVFGGVPSVDQVPALLDLLVDRLVEHGWSKPQLGVAA